MLNAAKQGVGVEVIEMSEGGFVVGDQSFCGIFPRGKPQFPQLMGGYPNMGVSGNVFG